MNSDTLELRQTATTMKDNENVTPLQKIVLFSFVFLMMGGYQMIMGLISLNTGLGEIKYPRFFLQVLPALYIIHRNFWKRSLKFPHLIIFLLMVSAFVLFESFLSPFSESSPHNYQFALDQLRIYIFFLMLVNFGLNRAAFHKVIDFAIYCGLLICAITYVGYSGLFKMNIWHSSVEFLKTKPQHIMYVNFVSLQCAFTILLIIIKQLSEKTFYPSYILRNFVFIVLLFGLIIINASRGAILISGILILWYIHFLWKNGIKNTAIKIFIFLIILISASALLSFTNISRHFSLSKSEIYTIKHFKEINIETEVRMINIRNAWDNFKEHPLTGVGYENASVRNNTGARSNTQYLQMLGSSGIIFFMIYILYNFRLIIYRFKLLKRPEITLSLVYFSMYILFERAPDMIAILGYVAFHYHYNDKRNFPRPIKHER